MDSSMYNPWGTQDEHRTTALPDEWAKDRPAQQSASDLPDFAALNDPAASNILASPQSFYSQYVTSPNYFLPQGSYTVPYGQPWPNATQVPLSSYSSLNGATTSSSTPQLQQQQSQPHQQSQQSPQQQQQSLQAHPSTSNRMIIECAFFSFSPFCRRCANSLFVSPNLTMNGAGSSSMQTSFSQPTSYGSQPQQQQQPRQQLQQQQQQQMQQQQSHQPQSQLPLQQRPQYNLNQLLFPLDYYHQQATSAPQGTLSPQALHSPTTSMMGISPAAFYAHVQSQHQLSGSMPIASTSQQQQHQQLGAETITASAPRPTAEEHEERKRKFLASIRPLLNVFSGAQGVRELTDRIVEYGVSEVDPATRLEILVKIRDGAPNHYYRAWAENTNAVDIAREWIKAAAKGNNAQLVETTMPLLHVSTKYSIFAARARCAPGGAKERDG
jgi:protein phosphatase 1 regulatory subunit 10